MKIIDWLGTRMLFAGKAWKRLKVSMPLHRERGNKPHSHSQLVGRGVRGVVRCTQYATDLHHHPGEASVEGRGFCNSGGLV